MRKSICFFLLFFFAIEVVSQKDTSDPTGWYLKLNTFSFLDPTYPTFQFGLEKRISLRHGIELSVGLPLKIKKSLKDTDSTYVHFYKIKSEIRFFSNKKPLHYFGLELFFTHVSYDNFNARFTREKEAYIADYAEFEKLIFGLAIKPGFLSRSKKTGKISGDFSVGLGIRFRQSNVNDQNSIPYSPGNNDWISLQPKEGLEATPHVSISLKMPIKI